MQTLSSVNKVSYQKRQHACHKKLLARVGGHGDPVKILIASSLIIRAEERHGNPPQGYQELLVVRDKVGRPPGELGVSKSMECDILPSVL